MSNKFLLTAMISSLICLFGFSFVSCGNDDDDKDDSCTIPDGNGRFHGIVTIYENKTYGIKEGIVVGADVSIGIRPENGPSEKVDQTTTDENGFYSIDVPPGSCFVFAQTVPPELEGTDCVANNRSPEEHDDPLHKIDECTNLRVDLILDAGCPMKK